MRPETKGHGLALLAVSESSLRVWLLVGGGGSPHHPDAQHHAAKYELSSAPRGHEIGLRSQKEEEPNEGQVQAAVQEAKEEELSSVPTTSEERRL